ncbi:MAG TPA: tryptophan-rich sensory protein [Intrasporangiaceae bacterium]|nr:tryptophan-rich sensory protein [Intrasporangiaceae bacterium]
MADPTGADRKRQIWVSAAYLIGIIGVLFGVGVLGTRVEESPGGDLSDDATLLAPHGPAFSIWTLIYVLLTAYVIYQWLPAQAGSRRQRAIGWLAGWTLILNAAWLLVTQAGWIWFSVLVTLALAAVLAALMFRLHVDATDNLVEMIVVNVTFGLYLGWVLAATGANVGAALASSDLGPGRYTAIGLILLVTIVGAALLRLFAGRISIALALAWGLGWIAVGRLFDEPADAVVGAVAGVCALVVLGIAMSSQPRAKDLPPRRPPLAL